MTGDHHKLSGAIHNKDVRRKRDFLDPFTPVCLTPLGVFCEWHLISGHCWVFMILPDLPKHGLKILIHFVR